MAKPCTDFACFVSRFVSYCHEAESEIKISRNCHVVQSAPHLPKSFIKSYIYFETILSHSAVGCFVSTLALAQALHIPDKFFVVNACWFYTLFKISLYLSANYRNIGDHVVACVNVYNLELKVDCILLK
jgi:hypothetical protein